MPGEDVYSWSPTAASNSSADSAIPWPEGMPRAQVNNSARSQMAALAKFRDLLNGTIVTGGTDNAQTFVSGVGYTQVPNGLRVLLKIGLANTGAATLNMDSIAAVPIKTQLGASLTAGALVLNSFAEFLYNGTNWILLQTILPDSPLTNGGITTGGTPNDQTADTGLTTLITGLRLLLKMGFTNTGPTTLDVDASGPLPPVAIHYPDGSELVGGELVAGSYAEFLYDGTNWILLQAVPVDPAAAAGGGIAPPMGRLTLVAGSPVMSTSAPTSTTIYYCPYVGNRVPIYLGASFGTTVFEELSALASDTTHSPAAIGSGVNDWFIWSDAGVLRLSHGPDWSSDFARSSDLVKVDGVWLNAADITNACAAQRGTYVGTTKASGGNFVWQIGGVDTPPQLFVWNAYNRVPTTARAKSSLGSFGYGTAAWATFGGLIVSAVFGLNEEPVAVNMPWRIYGAAGFLIVRISLDNSATLVPVTGSTEGAFVALPSATTGLSVLNDFLGLGLHTLYAMIQGDGVNTMTIYLGDNTVLLASLRM